MDLKKISMTLMRDDSEESVKISKFMKKNEDLFKKDEVNYREIHSDSKPSPRLLVLGEEQPIRGYIGIKNYIERNFLKCQRLN